MANKPRSKPGRRSDRTDPVLKLKSIFFLSIHSTKMSIFCVILCILLAMTIGVLTIYLTAPRPSTTCEPVFKRGIKSSLAFSSQPRSVVTDHINNDNNIDFVVANSGTDTIGVFIAQGNGTFTNQQTYSTGLGSNPHSLVINDFNNDSYADLVVANYATNNIGLFLGYGNGTFHDQQIISLHSSHPLFVTTGDFNKDDHIDIAVVNNGTNTVSILFGYGNGSFQDQVTYSTGYDSIPCSLAVGDFNNDTYLDIVVANSGTDNIGIFFNYGNGTFTNQHLYTTSHNSKPSSVAVGDFNNDNILDIVIANYGARSVGILFGYGNGSFLPQLAYMIGANTYPQYATVNDIDKDNVLDIIIIDSDNAQIHILPGYGNGSYGTIATYDGVSGSMPVWISVTDFNKNNQSDIVVVNYETYNVLVLIDYFTKPSARQNNSYYGPLNTIGTVAVSDFNGDNNTDIAFGLAKNIGILIGLGNLIFDKHRTYPTSNRTIAQYMCTRDVNNDHRMDIIIADTGLNGVGILLGYGNESFGNMTTYSTGIGSRPYWIAFGDFNDDNVVDMVTANYGTDSIGILLGIGNGSFILMTAYSVDYPLSVATGDINNDNRSDIVTSNGRGEVVIYLGQGDSTFILMITYVTGGPYYSFSVSLGDFNRDSHLDIVIANTNMDNVGILLGYGDGTFEEQTTYSTGPDSLPYYLIVVDCNNDNVSDVIATLHGSDEVVILYGYGNGSFQLERRYSTGFGSKPYGIVVANLDNDTRLEFIVALSGTGDIAILTEYQAAEFQNNIVYSTGSAPQPTSVSITDFNSDNQSDIVVANPGKDSISIFLASSNGTFGIEVQYSIGTNFRPQYVITCDVNRDHHIDIVTVNSQDNSISVIMGYGNGSFAKQLIYPTKDKSYPNAVVAGDINNDNRLDLVVANKGTDSVGILYGYDYTSFQLQHNYSSSENVNPQAIVVSDFNNDNILDIAAVFDDSDSWCILFGYGNGSFITPKTYSLPTDSGPQAIGVGDFNNDHQVDVVIANYGTSNIGIYLGYGNGSFSKIMLYSTGEDSGPIAVAVGDLNNDSRLDIVVANYLSGNICIFLGYGSVSFAIVMRYSTGIKSRPLSVTVGDFNNDNRLDIAVANYGTHNVGVLLGYGDGTFADQMILLVSNPGVTPTWITTGDFNRDNRLDIATAIYNADNVSILLGYGNGSFASGQTYSTGDGSSPYCISVGDFNNDNISDIAAANYGTNNIVVLFGFGDGSFLLGSPYSTGTDSVPWALVTGDFNQNGRLDIAVVNSKSNTIEIFLGDESQPFAGVTTYSIDDGSQPHSVALGDFNNDTLIDIAVANYGTDSVGILLGIDGFHFEPIQTCATGNDSAPYSVAIADFNNDTYLDIVVSNSGTDNIIIFLGDGTGQFRNGRTHPTGIQSRPYQVITVDFNNDNILDIAVANSGANNILLLYGYGDGTFGNDAFYPFVYGYQPYSIAAGDLNEDDWIDIAVACYGTDHVETLIKKCL